MAVFLLIWHHPVLGIKTIIANRVLYLDQNSSTDDWLRPESQIVLWSHHLKVF
ncbi:hypothetical protein [Nostoc sp. 106C]|uniref:hypothetical protein n=1 Tax=Nostoc sp. 106C TaxID=1932667 RepID=UPI00141202FE|nr:hypothetical protein [Nostoc sp. 106C]